MKIIDTHTHIFPDEVADVYMENYSGHSNLKAVCRPTFQGLLDEYKGFGEVKLVILQEWQSTIPFDSPCLKFMGSSHGYYYYSYNAWLGTLQRRNENLICFGGVHPLEEDRMDEFETMLLTHGLSGLKLPQCMQQFYVNDRRLFPVYERAEALNIPVLFHMGMDPIPGMDVFGHPMDAADVAKNFPHLTIILAHLGTPFYEETKEVLAKHERVFTDISFAIEIEPSEHMTQLVRDIGIEKCLFGSDFPFIRPKSALENFMALNLTEEERERVLFRNVTQVLHL